MLGYRAQGQPTAPCPSIISIHNTQWFTSTGEPRHRMTICEVFSLTGEVRGAMLCALTDHHMPLHHHLTRVCVAHQEPINIRSCSCPPAPPSPRLWMFQDVPAILSVSPRVSYFQRNLYSNTGRRHQSAALRNPEKPFLSREGLQGQLAPSTPLSC